MTHWDLEQQSLRLWQRWCLSKTKTCKRCGETKAIDEFRRCAPHICADGHLNTCSACIKPRAARVTEEDSPPPVEVAPIPEDCPQRTVAPGIGLDMWRQDGVIKLRQVQTDRVDEVWLTPGELAALIEFSAQE